MDLLNRLHIKTLLALNPVKFFRKLNQLDWYENTLNRWIASLHLLRKAEVLEIGCASGELSSRLAIETNVTAIDQSADMLKSAKKHHTSTINFQQADATQLPFDDNQFDCVISSSVLNIIPNQEAMMAEMFRVCKKGGKISVLVPITGFNESDLLDLHRELNLKGFSAAALNAWHHSAPKIAILKLDKLFKIEGLSDVEREHYLNYMLVSITASKLS